MILKLLMNVFYINHIIRILSFGFWGTECDCSRTGRPLYVHKGNLLISCLQKKCIYEFLKLRIKKNVVWSLKVYNIKFVWTQRLMGETIVLYMMLCDLRRLVINVERVIHLALHSISFILPLGLIHLIHTIHVYCTIWLQLHEIVKNRVKGSRPSVGL